MEEKNLVVLPDKVADYLESMKEKLHSNRCFQKDKCN